MERNRKEGDRGRQRESVYSWIADQQDAHKKLICQRTRRFTTLLRPPLVYSWRGESRSAWYVFVKFILYLLIFETSENMQIQIRLVEYFSSEVSDPHEVPRIDGKLFF